MLNKSCEIQFHEIFKLQIIFFLFRDPLEVTSPLTPTKQGLFYPLGSFCGFGGREDDNDDRGGGLSSRVPILQDEA